MKVIIDHDGCISCGLCVSTCPNVFRFAPDGKAVVRADPIPPEEEACAEQAAMSCPAGVIEATK